MQRFEKVIEAIDTLNRNDPNVTELDGKSIPGELLYAQRMTAMLEQYDTNASELLKIAARGQHVKRWSIPRANFSKDRKGYLKWRTQAKLMHAKLVGDIMKANNYEEHDISTAQDLIKKTKLKTDHLTQQLEDVVCLVFLKYYYRDFIKKHEEEKIINILKKTWGKMTEKGHKMALQIEFDPFGEKYLKKALA